jgi:CRP/FNR family transcriptional regulator, cyclic AMP receptor protein
LSPPLLALARRGELCQWPKGVQVMTEGEPGDTMLIVLAGRLRAYSVGDDEREISYASHGPGTFVGELAFDGGPRGANLQAETATLCARLTRTQVEKQLRADPQLALELLALAARHTRQATASLRRMALDSVQARLRALLDELTTPQPDGRRVADPAPSHLEMSRWLGCSREMVSRTMKALERDGYLQVGRRRVVILRPLPRRL